MAEVFQSKRDELAAFLFENTELKLHAAVERADAWIKEHPGGASWEPNRSISEIARNLLDGREYGRIPAPDPADARYANESQGDLLKDLSTWDATTDSWYGLFRSYQSRAVGVLARATPSKVSAEALAIALRGVALTAVADIAAAALVDMPDVGVNALAEAIKRIAQLESAVRWALGYDEGGQSFPGREVRMGGSVAPYGWRFELRRRAGMPADDHAATAPAPLTFAPPEMREDVARADVAPGERYAQGLQMITEVCPGSAKAVAEIAQAALEGGPAWDALIADMGEG